MSLRSEHAAQQAEIADLKGQLARALADCGHLKARLSIQSERMWAGDHRGISALQNYELNLPSDFEGCWE